MTVLSSFVNMVDDVLDYFSRKSKQSISDYCDIETSFEEGVLASKDGSLLSIIEIHGVRTLLGETNFLDNIVIPLRTALQTRFDSKGHKIQFWFQVDHDNTQREIRKILEPARETAKSLNLDMEDLFMERETNLSRWTAAESCYLVLWTTSDVLTKNDRARGKKRSKADKGKFVANSGTDTAQDPLAGIPELKDRHSSFVVSMIETLTGIGITSSLLNSHEGVREMRRSVDPLFTNEEWIPSLPGDKIHPSVRKHSPSKQEYEIMWPPIGWQVCPRDAEIVDDNIVKIGDRIYSPMYIDLFPREIESFDALFNKNRNIGLPWRISFLLEGDGLTSFNTKGLFSQILGFASSQNKMINAGVQQLKVYKEEQGETIVGIRAALCTWAPKKDKELLLQRSSELARNVEGWGSCKVSEVTGDPLAGVASSSLALTQGSIATKTGAPLDETIAMLPLTRPSSPWKTGAVTFRSPDGKLMPYQPYSSLQSTWINLIFARPGSGKSVLMNMCNLALCLLPGLKRLPRIAIVDIGPSSSGLISLLKEALPKEQQNQVLYHKLRMTEKDSINPFDTQLGCRYPTPSESAFLKNFITLIVTEIGENNPDGGMPGFVANIIKEMYVLRSDKVDPIKYVEEEYYEVDEVLKKTSMYKDAQTTWWEVVDHLFKHGYYDLAKVAQRQAVPLLTDAITISQTEKMKRQVEGIIVDSTKETLHTAFARRITEALDLYPILSRPTQFDVDYARVVALDLDEVAKGDGAISDKVTAVMYMLARQVLTKDFRIDKATVDDMPAPPFIIINEDAPIKEYREYHYKKMEESKEDPKRICYDEFHRTSKATQVREQLIVDMREGRKWKTDIMLASQDIGDFDQTMIDFSTGLFIMDSGTASTVEKISKSFGFENEEEVRALQNRVHPPKKGGGTFMAKFQTQEKRYTMLLSATLGPVELWAFSTTAEDMVVRNRLYESIGPKRARQLLAMKYPGGSVKKEVEERAEKRKKHEGSLIKDQSKSIYDEIIEELLDFGEEREII